MVTEHEPGKAYRITPFAQTVIGAFVSLVLLVAGFLVVEIRSAAHKVEQLDVSAKAERDLQRQELRSDIASVRQAVKDLRTEMFYKREHVIYDEGVKNAFAALETRLSSIETRLEVFADWQQIRGMQQ